MTVQGLFQSIDKNEFVKTYLRNDSETLDLIFDSENVPVDIKMNKIIKFRQLIFDTLEKFRTMDVERNDKYIVFAIPEYEGDAVAHSFLSLRSEILSVEEIDRVECYAYEFSPFKEILSYDVSASCKYEIDDDIALAVSIFNEMTFCGITEESHDERVSEITEDINSAIKEVEDGDSDKFTNAADFFEQLGWVDNRTEREKKFSLEIAEIDGRAKNKIYKKYFEMEKHYLTQNID